MTPRRSRAFLSSLTWVISVLSCLLSSGCDSPSLSVDPAVTTTPSKAVSPRLSTPTSSLSRAGSPSPGGNMIPSPTIPPLVAEPLPSLEREPEMAATTEPNADLPTTVAKPLKPGQLPVKISVTPANPTSPPQSPTASAARLRSSEITPAMALEDVEKILGGPGQVLSATDHPPKQVIIWQFSDRSTLQVVFSDGKAEVIGFRDWQP